MQRIRGLRPGSWTMLSSSCSSSERGSTSSSGELGAVGGAFGVIAAGAKSRRSNSVCVFCSTTNSYGDVNTKTSSTGLACDQCGDTFYSAASPSPSPLEPPLAVCRAPGCGVAFSQCPRCKVEYAGCCSAACQTLAAEEGAPRIAAAVVVEEVVMVEGFDKRGRRAKHESPPLNRDSYDEEEEEEELVAVGVARSAASTEGSTLAIVPEIRAVVGAAAGGGGTPPSKQEPVQSGRRKGGDKNAKAGASFTTPRGGISDAGSGAEGGGGGKGKRKRGRDGETDEPSLESYASRHSEPESPCLSDVRESTIRYFCTTKPVFYCCRPWADFPDTIDFTIRGDAKVKGHVRSLSLELFHKLFSDPSTIVGIDVQVVYVLPLLPYRGGRKIELPNSAEESGRGGWGRRRLQVSSTAG